MHLMTFCDYSLGRISIDARPGGAYNM